MNALRSLFALLGAAALAAGPLADDAHAQRRQPRAQTLVQQKPMLAVVGLREQHITVYDSTGAQMLSSPVSSGTAGYETPPGIFSIVQKNLEHHSNLYDDASMPFMQRLTWTGIALHEGVVPGYPASHGCVRLPGGFAEKLFGLTDIGMRVVVAREAIAPVAIAAPSLFRRNAAAGPTAGSADRPVQLASAEADADLTSHQTSLTALQSRIAPLTDAANEATRRARELATAAGRASAAVQPAERKLRPAEAALAKAEAELQAAEKVIASGGPEKKLADAEKAKAAAPARIEAARAQLEKVKAEAEAKRAAANAASEAAAAAANAQVKAHEAVQQARQSLAPVSVFVSRRTQRIYVRKAFHPLWEGPVEIRNADKPIGTFVFTANEPAPGTRDLRWSVVSLYKNPTAIEPAQPPLKKSKKNAAVEMPLTDASAAQAALDRLEVPAAIADRISEIVLPGSSLIISDEPPSIETGKDTDFVVVMSGEPQGALAMRKQPQRDDDDDVFPPRSSRPTRVPSGGGFGFWFN